MVTKHFPGISSAYGDQPLMPPLPTFFNIIHLYSITSVVLILQCSEGGVGGACGLHGREEEFV